ncbi:hypothetical protein SK128_000187, partial [Halocaridina rubra]
MAVHCCSSTFGNLYIQAAPDNIISHGERLNKRVGNPTSLHKEIKRYANSSFITFFIFSLCAQWLHSVETIIQEILSLRQGFVPDRCHNP